MNVSATEDCTFTDGIMKVRRDVSGLVMVRSSYEPLSDVVRLTEYGRLRGGLVS